MATPKNPETDQVGETKTSAPYLVMARKYRPLDFSALIGQGPMVQTLSNAFKSGRIHHAFILTGVRGVGKTTTARILARAFNYVGEHGPQPTLDLSVPGEHCEAIIEGRHVDVVEMDAASNTGVDDVRDIIESVRYGPVSAPYKVFIIDEVHMLSKNAFNALLKTLEEPPPYVKFIFATTEIRKVPVTILSRCMRFDLRRIPADIMSAYLGELLEKEAIKTDADALSMIVRAGEGSVRDCLSLLDQAIAFGDGSITAETVRSMLGLADRSHIIELFTALMGGDIAGALQMARSLYDEGADPATIVADLAELTHLVTRIKAVPETVDDPALTPDERTRGADLAQKLGMRDLTRAWQILQAGLGEIARAGNAMQSAEMVLIRLAHAADLPTPDELIEKLQNSSAASASPPPGNGGSAHAGAPRAGLRGSAGLATSMPSPSRETPAPQARHDTAPEIRSFDDLVALAVTHRDLMVKHALETYVRPVAFEPGRLRVALTDDADVTIVSTISARLKAWTGRNWMISVDNDSDAPQTRAELRKAEEQAAETAAAGDPLVQAVLKTFPKSKIVNVRVNETVHEALPDSTDDAETDSEDFE